MKKYLAGIVMLGLVSCASVLVAVRVRRQLVNAPFLEAEIAKSGPCFGQEEIARLSGLDLVTAERARSLAGDQGIAVCVDVLPPQGMLKSPFMEIYDWPKFSSQTKSLLFGDQEINREALHLPEFRQGNDPKLPSPNWAGKAIESLEPHPSGEVVGVIRKALDSRQYRTVARGRRPTYYAVAERKPLPVWGKEHPYDLYFRFGKKEMQKFEVIPGMDLVYVGRLESFGLPEELTEQ